ncbi:hypothetical protein F5884DRAFT_808967 [Xylogone sp. PMI_703]|nr:hypothetical protein F5884DRAFT_808967 [Xylogone sp. PMI_703]
MTLIRAQHLWNLATGEEQYSTNGSPMFAPSTGHHLPASPMSSAQRHIGDYQYMNHSSLPGHLRGEYLGYQPPTNPLTRTRCNKLRHTTST